MFGRIVLGVEIRLQIVCPGYRVDGKVTVSDWVVVRAEPEQHVYRMTWGGDL